MRKLLIILIFILFLFGCVVPATQLQITQEEDSFNAPIRAISGVDRVKKALEKKYPDVLVENWYGYADEE